MSIERTSIVEKLSTDRRIEILVADPDPAVGAMVRDILQNHSESWQVETATDGREALDAVSNRSFDVAILNTALPNLNRTEVLGAARRRHIPTKVVFLAEDDKLELAVRAVKQGAQAILGKPIDAGGLVSAVLDLIGNLYSPPQALASRLDAYLKEHVSNPSLSRGDLCRHFRISPGYVTRLFREFFKTTFRRRRAYHRVERAKKLMSSGRVPLYAIAAQCGFKTQSRFTETFRRLEGIPPRTYQETMASDWRNG